MEERRDYAGKMEELRGMERTYWLNAMGILVPCIP